ncbi:MAG: DUF1015 family protein [bacterium]|nr:DUF1015 family protein [bacterium]
MTPSDTTEPGDAPGLAGLGDTNMDLVAPFAGWVVRPEWADKVVSRAYDNLTPEQRRSLVADNPYSYMNVTRGPEDNTGSDGPLVSNHETLAAHGRSALARLLEVDVFSATGRAALYLYRLNHAQGEQTGVVCTVSIAGFSEGRIRIHENVRSERAALLQAHLLGVGATSSPVAMALQTPPDLLELLTHITSAQQAELEFGSEEVRHQVWTVPEHYTEPITKLLSRHTLYVTDGHHRSAAAVGALQAEPNNPSLGRLLAILFCDSQLHVQAFHRLAIDQHNRSAQDCLTALAAHVHIEPASSAHEAQPTQPGTTAMYLNGCWYKLHLPPSPKDANAVSKLDVDLLRRHVLGPVLGIDELSGPAAVEYLPAEAGYEEMTSRCDTENRIGFVLWPMSVAELMSVADEGGLMPPKSSFFSPKPRSGVFLRPLGRGATAHLPSA